jgi:helicase
MSISVLVNPQRTKLALMQISNLKKTPLSCGTLTLAKTAKGMRPFKFMSGKRFKKPADAIEMLRSADQILLASGDLKTADEFLEMLSGYQLSCEPVSACRHCLLENRFSLIDKQAIKSRGELICPDCAITELHRELAPMRFGEPALERIEKLLLKTGDLDRVRGMLDPDVIDPELTLYSTIAATGQKEPTPMRVQDLPVPERLKNLLAERLGLEELLPVQSLSIKSGLLKGAGQLVVSDTATGKTLIGELAGIKNLLEGRGNFLFMVPLVALAHQKEEDFRKRYDPLGITTVLQVGASRIMREKGRKSGKPTKSTTVWVGTYEGVDYLLRSGKAGRLGRIGTVVIDEVHTLADEERGHRMDGLIARLKYISTKTQFIYLSATVGNPASLSKMLFEKDASGRLVRYGVRPVPIELHLLFAGGRDKIRIIDRLARHEWNTRSSKGYRGQTIVFTNSRQRCHKIAKSLRINAAAYHAGLAQQERRRITSAFAAGRLEVVVTTAALAAGVDFPASQVIFESLAMGIDWLSVHEFHQMLGRAGRPDYHDLGKVVVIAEPDRRYHGGGETEDEIAFKLLKHEVEPVDVVYEEPEQMEELLACAALSKDRSELRALNDLLIGGGDFEYLFGKLTEYGLITPSARLTDFGRIVTTHFLSIEQAFLIRDAVKKGEPPLDTVVSLETFEAVYFKDAGRIANALNVHIPTRVFQGASYDLVFSGESIAALDKDIRDQILSFVTEFMVCPCPDTPYCGCAERKFSKRLIELRCEGISPNNIVQEISDDYGVYAYPADILEYLDQVVRNLEAIEMVAAVFGNDAVKRDAMRLRKGVEG